MIKLFKMKKSIYILTLLFLTSTSQAQVTFNIAYELPSYEYVHGLVQDSNGDYIISGTSGSFQDDVNAQAFIMRVDVNGAWKWFKYYGTPEVDNGQNVSLMANGDLGICGYSDGNRPNDYDIFMIRTDNNGDQLWMKFYGGDSWDIANYSRKTQDDGFIIVGKTYSFGAGAADAYMIRTDSNGDTLWTRTFGTALNEEFNGVVATADGGFAAIGYTESSQNGMKDAYLVKVDANGNLLWERQFGGARDDIGNFIDETHEGDIIWTGSNSSDVNSNGNSDIENYRLDANGNDLFTRILTNYGQQTFNEVPHVIHQTKDNRYIIAAFSEGLWVDQHDFLLLRVNNQCGWEWGRIYSCVPYSEEIIGDMIVAQDSGFVVALSTTHGDGPTNVQLVKMDQNGLGNSDDCFIGVDEIENNDAGFSFYPNPTTEFLTIRPQTLLEQGKAAKLNVYDNTGRTVLFPITLVHNRESKIDVGKLPTGIYYMQIVLKDGVIGRSFLKK